MLSDMPDQHPDPPNGTGDMPPLPEAGLRAGEITAREAVRRAVAELGPDADVDDVLAHLQAKFGLCPPRGTVQTYVYLLRRDARDDTSSEPRRRGRHRKSADNGTQPSPPAPAVEEVIEAVAILRDLCDRLGDDNLRRLLDAL